MAAERNVRVGVPLWRNPTLRWLLLGYSAVWLVAAVSPHDRGDWLLENLLVFLAVPLFALSQWRLPLSNFSNASILVFLSLHAIGAHYTYSLTPLGFWLGAPFGAERNHFDRIVHLAFGLLLTYPVREIARRALHLRGIGRAVVPLCVVIALSASYEILESWAAGVVDPQLGIAFVGAQGDAWDAQKDMSLALLGAILSLLGTQLYLRRHGHEPWVLLEPRRADDLPER